MKNIKTRKHFTYNGVSYSVSPDGRVFGKDGVELSQRLNEDGYPMVTLGSKGARRGVRVHRIVCENFVENPENKPEVNHIDGVKTNNHFSNLEWATRQEQVIHAFKLGLKVGPKGSKNGRSILTEKDIPVIRNMFIKGITKSEIARTYGVGWSTINRVLSGNTWKDVK